MLVLLFHEARKPNVVLAPAPRLPLYGMFVATTGLPAGMLAPHDWVMLWPFAHVQVTRQLVIGALPAVTRTSPWKPPGHCCNRVYVAVQARVPPPLGDGEADGERDGDGEVDGDRDGLTEGVGEPVWLP